MNIFAQFEASFVNPLENFMNNAITGFAEAVNGPLQIAVLLYVVLYGYYIMRGTIQEPAMDFAWTSIKLVIIVTLATHADVYNDYVRYVFFEALPEQAQTAFNVSGNTEPNSFDSLVVKAMNLGWDLFERAGTFDVHIYAFGCAVMLVGGIAALVMYAVVLFAKVALALVLAVGPVFIALLMFQSTRRFGESWIGTLVNFAVLQTLAVAIVSLAVTTLDGLVNTTAEGGDLVVQAVSAIVVLILGAVIAYQLPSIASSLAGGGPILADPAQPLSRGIAHASSRAADVTYRGGRAVGSATAQGARNFYNRIRD